MLERNILAPGGCWIYVRCHLGISDHTLADAATRAGQKMVKTARRLTSRLAVLIISKESYPFRQCCG